MKRIIATICLIMVTMSSALAQQAKDVTNNKSNMNDSIKREQSEFAHSAERENLRTKFKSFKSTAWLLPQPVLIIGTYDKGGRIK